ncbi:helix-turn-helix transcriptional regulator [Salegentibacter sp. F188]|uniref:Helix-turn-helix transcriptional regulator n=1 Tax=Autumnicola patrickiae TaxID=3075591 RepID=A0ABU3E4J2_9FLAO|nr:helix-turn-helix transcriptional regulator [Salegentibacter sp. F188]MDT0690923.1 helix-turn-helix transcriptional regulator [Salegentibacter sp. F188]
MMFGTSIHWTTFFYLLIDTVIVFIAVIQSAKHKKLSLRRYITLGLLYIAYNLTGGFLPTDTFPEPIIVQYIITYGVAIALCIYMIYYLYKDYDITLLKFRLSVRNITILIVGCFIILFLIPYFLTNSLDSARLLFTIPVSIIAFAFLGLFYQRISNLDNPDSFFSKRNKLAIVSLCCIALLPILTVIGDYQWLTFTVMNLAFYAIAAMEINRYLCFLKNRPEIFDVFAFTKEPNQEILKTKIIYGDLTRREVEIALSILRGMTYKEIAKDLYIAESTVSKHASNIFKKTGSKNRSNFLSRFRTKKN